MNGLGNMSIRSQVGFGEDSLVGFELGLCIGSPVIAEKKLACFASEIGRKGEWICHAEG